MPYVLKLWDTFRGHQRAQIKEKGAQVLKFRGQLIKGFWQFWTDFFDIGTVGIVRDSQNDSGGQTIKFCSFRGSNGVKWGSTGGND